MVLRCSEWPEMHRRVDRRIGGEPRKCDCMVRRVNMQESAWWFV